MLAYGKGYVQLEGKTLRVIPHVQNLETCARHCDMDSQCTHWRRCAGAPALPPLLPQEPLPGSCCRVHANLSSSQHEEHHAQDFGGPRCVHGTADIRIIYAIG